MTGQFPYGGGPGPQSQQPYGPQSPPPYPPQQQPYPPQPQRQYSTSPVPYPAPYPQQQAYPPPQQQPQYPTEPVKDDRSAGEILAGGGGAPALQVGPETGTHPRYTEPGEERGGRIVKIETRQERRKRRDEVTGRLVDDGPAFSKSGRPFMGVILTVDSGVRDPNIENDDGRRRIFIEGRAKRDAAGDALRQANVDPRQHPMIGGEMYVSWTRQFYRPNSTQLSTEWVFRYVPPAPDQATAPAAQPQPQYAPPTGAPGHTQPPPTPPYAPQPQPAAQPYPGAAPAPSGPQQGHRPPPWERGQQADPSF